MTLHEAIDDRENIPGMERLLTRQEVLAYLDLTATRFETLRRRHGVTPTVQRSTLRRQTVNLYRADDIERLRDKGVG